MAKNHVGVRTAKRLKSKCADSAVEFASTRKTTRNKDPPMAWHLLDFTMRCQSECAALGSYPRYYEAKNYLRGAARRFVLLDDIALGSGQGTRDPFIPALLEGLTHNPLRSSPTANLLFTPRPPLHISFSFLLLLLSSSLSPETPLRRNAMRQ